MVCWFSLFYTSFSKKIQTKSEFRHSARQDQMGVRKYFLFHWICRLELVAFLSVNGSHAVIFRFLPGLPGNPSGPSSPVCPFGPGIPAKPSPPRRPGSPGRPLNPRGPEKINCVFGKKEMVIDKITRVSLVSPQSGKPVRPRQSGLPLPPPGRSDG